MVKMRYPHRDADLLPSESALSLARCCQCVRLNPPLRAGSRCHPPTTKTSTIHTEEEKPTPANHKAVRGWRCRLGARSPPRLMASCFAASAASLAKKTKLTAAHLDDQRANAIGRPLDSFEHNVCVACAEPCGNFTICALRRERTRHDCCAILIC